MRLSELKKMVKEEYTRYLAEQAMPSLPPNPGAGGASPMGGPGAGPGAGAPKVTVEPGDIDVMGSEDAEATLRDIYDMLKDYFEGGEEMGDEMPPMDDVEGGGDEEADLAEWTGNMSKDKKATTTHSGKYGAAGYKNFSKTSGHTGFGDAGGSKKLNEIKRMKKLANIIK